MIEPPTLAQLYARTTRDGECLIWCGAVDGKGYGNVGRMRGGETKNWIVHRLVYEHAVGPIPEGHEIHHVCERRLCVNPEHLEAVTRREHHGLDGRHPRHTAKALAARGYSLKPRRCIG